MSASSPRFASESAEAQSRLTALAVYSASWRFQKAEVHAARAMEAASKGMHSTAKWHSNRARGLRRRFDTIAACGRWRLKRSCKACDGAASDVAAFCGAWKICAECRSRYQSRYRARFHSARTRVMRRGLRLGVGEKFVTLTVPHLDPVQDAEILAKSYGRFRESLIRYLCKYRGYHRKEARRLSYVRVMECTPGTRDDGHAHLHLWMLAPFIDKRLIAVLWWCALPWAYRQRATWVPMEAPGTPNIAAYDRAAIMHRVGSDTHMPLLSVDVQAVHGDDVANELIKYLVKNRKEGEWIDPQIEAELYEAMDGRRSVSTSRGFWGDLQESPHCEHCGCVGEGYHVHPELTEDAKMALERQIRGQRTVRGPPGATSFLDTPVINPTARETIAEFDEACGETGSPDSHWVREPGWSRGAVDTRPGK